MEADEALNAIFLTDPEDDFWGVSTSGNERVPHTASWILESAEYKHWKAVSFNALLWISGSPGKGKTMISMALIDELRQNSALSRNHWLSFFLCDRDDYRRNSASAIVRGIAYQILRKHPRARHILRSEYDKQKGSLVSSPNSIYALWRILHQVISYLVCLHYHRVSAKCALIYTCD